MKKVTQLREADLYAQGHTAEPGFALGPKPFRFALCHIDSMKGKKDVSRWLKEEWCSRQVKWRGQRLGAEGGQCFGGPVQLKPGAEGRSVFGAIAAANEDQDSSQ